MATTVLDGVPAPLDASLLVIGADSRFIAGVSWVTCLFSGYVPALPVTLRT